MSAFAPYPVAESYQDRIRIHLAAAGRIGANPRHVEGAMRANVGTLDALTPAGFRRVALAALDEIDAMTEADAERLAESYGLFPTVRK